MLMARKIKYKSNSYNQAHRIMFTSIHLIENKIDLNLS